jgi:hypothetical protein
MPFTLVCILVWLAFATTPDDADLAAWFKNTWADAVEHRIPSGFKYEWTISAAETIDHGRITALDAEVAGKPEHPRRAELTMLKRLAHEPLVVTKVLWTINDEFRVNRTSSWRDEGYFDQAVRHDVAWGCGSSGQLTS